MNKSHRNGLVLSIALTLASHGVARSRAADNPQPDATVHVRVFNYAQASESMMEKATREAARVLRKAGVETVWHECKLTKEEVQKDAACDGLPAPTDLVLRLIPRSMAQGYGLHHSRFGIAMPAPKLGFGSHASVFFHRAEELADSQYADQATILGHLFAHEIGHLLLGPNSHARSGIMRVPWDKKRLERAFRGSLLFNTRQAQKIRSQVQERVQASLVSR